MRYASGQAHGTRVGTGFAVPASVLELLGGESKAIVDQHEVSAPPDVSVPPELLADLYDPQLVIFPEYVGSDRRRAGGSISRIRGGDRRSLRLGQIVMVILLTVAATVPLTLIASHASSAPVTTRTVPRATAAHQEAVAARHAVRAGRTRGLASGTAQLSSPVARAARTVGASPTRAAATSMVACGATGTLAPATACARRQANLERHAVLEARRAARELARNSSAASMKTGASPLTAPARPGTRSAH